MRLTIRLILFLGAVVVLVGVDAVVARDAANERERARAASVPYRNAGNGLDDLTRALADQHDAAQSFLVTGDDRFSARYDMAGLAAADAIATIRVLEAADEQVAALLPAATATIDSWQQATAEAMALASPPAGVAVEPAAAVDVARTTYDDARDQLEALEDEITTGGDATRLQVQSTYDRLVRIITITLIAIVLIAVALALLLSRWVRRPVDRLSRSVEMVDTGRLDQPIVASGPPEFVQIGEAVERMRVRLIAELDRSARASAALATTNAELEAFSYSVSHDLRAPLRAIDGFGVALVEDAGDELSEDSRRHVERIRAATRRMAELIDDLLRLARVSRVEPNASDIDVTELAGSVASDVIETVDRPVHVTIQPGLRASADPALVRIVFENLLGNAVKFTAGQSRPTVEVSGEGAPPHTRFTVADNGAGFDQKYADKLFAPFQRLHSEREFPGTGIGLATVARIVHRHGGEVTATGSVGNGARIAFTLAPPPRESLDATA